MISIISYCLVCQKQSNRLSAPNIRVTLEGSSGACMQWCPVLPCPPLSVTWRQHKWRCAGHSPLLTRGQTRLTDEFVSWKMSGMLLKLIKKVLLKIQQVSIFKTARSVCLPTGAALHVWDRCHLLVKGGRELKSLLRQVCRYLSRDVIFPDSQVLGTSVVQWKFVYTIFFA